jgi:uncharacterized protein (TIGR02444 family)
MTSSNQKEISVSLWEFACDFYGNKPVEEICLDLQNTWSFDVDVLLFCLWSGTVVRVSLDGADWDLILSLSDHWQKDVVTPLRLVRQQLKLTSPPGMSEDFQGLRENIKRLELQAERLELEALQDLLIGDRAHPASPLPLISHAQKHIETYVARALSHRTADISEATKQTLCLLEFL